MSVHSSWRHPLWKMHRVVSNHQAREYWSDLCGGHRKKPAVPAAKPDWCHTSRSESREFGLHFSSRMVHTHIQKMSSCTSHMTYLVACPVELFFRALRICLVLDTMFTVHEFLRLFPLVLYQRLSTAPNRTLFRSCKRKLKRSQVACYATDLATLWFFYSESTRSKDLIWNIYSHEDYMHTNCPLKWALIHVSQVSVPYKMTNVPCIETVAYFCECPVLEKLRCVCVYVMFNAFWQAETLRVADLC